MTFRIGQKVVCVLGPISPVMPSETSATIGQVYTVRAIRVFEGCVGLHLCEIINPKMMCDSGYHERYMAVRRFRPLVERKTSIEVFEKMLTGKRVDA